jgi:hypothetical protein
VIVKRKPNFNDAIALAFIWLENRPIEVEELFKMELLIQKTKCASSPLRILFVL